MNVELLKAKILDLAIHGKLVPQLDSEPAVEQIGEVPDEIPFEIPEKWKWVKFNNVIQTIPTKDYQIKISDLATSGLFPVVSQSTKNFIDGYISTSKEKLLNPKLLPIIVFGDHTRVTKYIDFPFIVGSD